MSGNMAQALAISNLKSLVYFADAEEEAMPLMIKPLNWDDVKKTIISIAKGFQLG
jgi:hypothetical protein